MAKDNFLLKKSQRDVVKELSDEQAGILFKAIYDYVETGKNDLTGILNAIFIPFKKDIDDNEKKYQEVCKRNQKNGTNGGRPRKPKETEENRVGYFGKNTHISYIINNINYNLLNIILNNKYKLYKTKYLNNKLKNIKQIIEYLNNKIKSNYKYTTKATQQKINARLNEGYKLDDFIAVIDKKYEEWLGTEFENYLCPDTLFGTKFEKYLNQKPIKNKKEVKPDWFDKEPKKVEATAEEIAELDEILKKYDRDD